MTHDRPIGSPWVDISLSALAANVMAIRSCLKDPGKLIAVIKDNAYGCGAVPLAQALQRLNITFFAVARIAEAKELRATGIVAPILVMGKVSEFDMVWASAHQVRLAVYDTSDLDAYASAPVPLTIHLKVDTGMGRLGLSVDELSAAADRLRSAVHLKTEGVFTHFACADALDDTSFHKQRAVFAESLSILKNGGLDWTMTHASNSAATFSYGTDPQEWARTGIALYGCSPNLSRHFKPTTTEILSLRSHIIKLKVVAQGIPLSYGWNWTASRTSRIATIPLGYANGLPRSLTGKGSVLVHGISCPIVGNITMDYIMVDVTDVPLATAGSVVTAIGTDGNVHISADEIAKACGTIGYEIITRIPDRVPRFYLP